MLGEAWSGGVWNEGTRGWGLGKRGTSLGRGGTLLRMALRFSGSFIEGSHESLSAQNPPEKVNHKGGGYALKITRSLNLGLSQCSLEWWAGPEWGEGTAVPGPLLAKEMTLEGF